MDKPDNLELRKGNVVIDRIQKHAYSQGKGSWERITVNCCALPGGLMIPPFYNI